LQQLQRSLIMLYVTVITSSSVTPTVTRADVKVIVTEDATMQRSRIVAVKQQKSRQSVACHLSLRLTDSNCSRVTLSLSA